MWSILLFIVIIITTNVQANMYHECGKLFNPVNYMDKLPSLSLPYVDTVPNIPPIKPSPVARTKVVSVVTKYVYRNPVCVKISGKKPLCKPLNSPGINNIEYLVTKEYFVRDRKTKQRHLKDEDDGLGMYVQSSEEPRPFSKQKETPILSQEEVKDMLIEDRLDQLETILPHYTRRRVFQTSTITVTKVKSNNRATATLLVKNCVPQGYDLCPPKVRQRKSKIVEVSNITLEQNYYG